MSRNVAECIILNNKGEVLLQKKTLDYPLTHGKWGIPGGVIKNNEDPKKAIVREIHEETGLTIEPKFYISKNYKYGNAKIYTARIDNHTKIYIREGAGFAFVDRRELNDIKINDFDLTTLRDFFKNGN